MDITGAVTMEACIEWDDFLEGTPLADANYDGEVTVADYEVWKSHFAMAVSAVSSSIASKVPTPSANLLLLASMPLFGRLYMSRIDNKSVLRQGVPPLDRPSGCSEYQLNN